jgi:hypothetical protein
MLSNVKRYTAIITMEVFVSELQQVFNFDLSALVKIYTSSTSTTF